MPVTSSLISGGFTCGKWSAPTPWVNRAFADHGYAVVSVGYRLQPQASLLDMVDDCVDAAAWCRKHLPSIANVDPDRWVVGGASSGATLASYTAHRADPPPKAFVNVYGLIDTADYYHHDKARSLAVDPYFVSTEEEMEIAIRDVDPSKAVTQNPWASEMPPEVPLAEARESFGLPDWEPSQDQFRRIDLYSYVAKHRHLMDVIYRREQFGSDDEFMNFVRAHSPYHLLDEATSYPATFNMHGTSDDIVRIQQSYQLAEKLRSRGVPVGEVYDEGKGHVYDFAFMVSLVEAQLIQATRR